MSKYKISELADEISIRENNPKNSDYDKFVGLEHYDSGNIMIKRYGTTEKLDSAMKVFENDDILIARRNVYLKRASMVKFDGLTSGDSIVLRAKNESIKRLLPFVFNTESFWNYAISHADGSMSKRLSPALLMEYETNLPDNDKDRDKLADVLWSINDTLDSYKEQLRLCDELVKAQFIEMFGKLDKKYIIDDVVCSKVDSVKKVYKSSDTIKYIDISSIDNSKNEIINYTNILMGKAPSRAQQCIIKNDILVSTVRPNLKNIAINKYDFNDMVASSGFCILRCEKCIPEYILSIVTSDDFTDSMCSLTTGANYPAIRDKDVKNYKIALPTIDEQNKFADFYLDLDKSKFDITRLLLQIDIIKKELFS